MPRGQYVRKTKEEKLAASVKTESRKIAETLIQGVASTMTKGPADLAPKDNKPRKAFSTSKLFTEGILEVKVMYNASGSAWALEGVFGQTLIPAVEVHKTLAAAQVRAQEKIDARRIQLDKELKSLAKLEKSLTTKETK